MITHMEIVRECIHRAFNAAIYCVEGNNEILDRRDASKDSSHLLLSNQREWVKFVVCGVHRPIPYNSNSNAVEIRQLD